VLDPFPLPAAAATAKKSKVLPALVEKEIRVPAVFAGAFAVREIRDLTRTGFVR